MDSIKEVLRENLLRLRGQRTQVEIARLAGMPLKSYQYAEAGNVPRPTQRQKLAKVFGVKEPDLFFDNDRVRDCTPEEALEVIRKALKLHSK